MAGKSPYRVWLGHGRGPNEPLTVTNEWYGDSVADLVANVHKLDNEIARAIAIRTKPDNHRWFVTDSYTHQVFEVPSIDVRVTKPPTDHLPVDIDLF